MREKAIHIDSLPELNRPVLIAGFDGWGNALNVSKGMASFLIRELKADKFAWINPDRFYRYDENRPWVRIEGGELKKFSPPGGALYAGVTPADDNDVVILQADEPVLNWFHFVGALFSLCENLGVKIIITLGSMYDSVLHSDRLVSGLDSDRDPFSGPIMQKVIPIDYQGPSAIHSIIQSEGPTQGMRCVSLWGHCPYYLQGITHYGLISELVDLVSLLGNFTLDTQSLEARWTSLEGQIEKLMHNNADLRKVVDQLEKTKQRGTRMSMKKPIPKGEKVINLTDFLNRND